MSSESTAPSISSLQANTLQTLLLKHLDENGEVKDSRDLVLKDENGAAYAVKHGLGGDGDDILALKSALDSLKSKEMITYTAHTTEIDVLTAEGLSLASSGSHEYRVFCALPPAGSSEPLTMSQLSQAVGAESAKIGQGKAFKNGWIQKAGQGFTKKVESVVDETKEHMLAIKGGKALDAKVMADYRKRKLCEKKKLLHFEIKKGEKFSTTIEALETDVTMELLASGAWKTANFKKFNFEAEGVVPASGALHPLMKVREEFRNIFFEMGFQEMPTNRFVESAFWCFDTLFVPQQHPAREAQDTFYVSSPSAATDDGLPVEYLKRVKEVHEVGGYGSIGYRAPFSIEETKRLVLRTHTTAISSRMLYELANQPGGFKPAKMFSIDRVFRNEAVDATHLAEFHQIEGVVADYNLTLGDLIGFMEVFFAKMGVTDLRFKMTYNPYTEPSMEMYSYHQGLKKWVEIGNSGVFRPEMLEPMGFPPGVRVHGWGLSLERPTMIRYGISNIRELLGHKVDLENVGKAEAVRF